MNEEPINRSEFLRSFVRTGLFAGLTALGAVLCWRSRTRRCVNLAACRGCPELPGCSVRETLDELSARRSVPVVRTKTKTFSYWKKP